MKTKILYSVMAFIVMTSALGQTSALEFTFTAVNNAAYVRLDSVRVINRTRGGATLIHWPDTTLTFTFTPGDTLLFVGYSFGFPVGIGKHDENREDFQLFRNYPNPVVDQSMFRVFIPEKGTVIFTVSDLQGREVINQGWLLDTGFHTFLFKPGTGNLFFITARWNTTTRSIKIMSANACSGNKCSLDHVEGDEWALPLKPATAGQSSVKESGIPDAPQTNKTYTFQFATKIPCPGIPTITYGGKIYNTRQIYSQCWLKENLNVGTMINGTLEMQNNGVIEKYCYNNLENNCSYFGALYQWNEVMQYTTSQGAQGICPPGWHIPTDEEWKVLEGAADSQYGIGDPIWDTHDFRGYDAGKVLKSASSWYGTGNGTNALDFSGLAGGFRANTGDFVNMGYQGIMWTSSQVFSWGRWYRFLGSFYNNTERYWDDGSNGYGVRCLKD